MHLTVASPRPNNGNISTTKVQMTGDQIVAALALRPSEDQKDDYRRIGSSTSTIRALRKECSICRRAETKGPCGIPRCTWLIFRIMGSETRQLTATAVAFLVMLCGIMISSAHASSPYNRLKPETRFIIQRLLIWTGHYPGPLDGDIGPATVRALQGFQNDVGERPTGLLSKNAIRALLDRALNRQKAVGYRIIRDDQTGARIGLPHSLVDESRPVRNGTRYHSPDNDFEIETFSLSVSKRDLSELHRVLTESIPNRRVTYSVFRSNWFVLAGTDNSAARGERAFYVRAHTNGTDIIGFSVSLPNAMESRIRHIISSMSFDFDPFPTTEMTTTPERKDIGRNEQGADSKMIFVFDDKTRSIFAVGDITYESGKEFDAYVSRNAEKLKPFDQVTVVLQSPGGNLSGGIELGRAIRQHEFATSLGRLRIDELDEKLVVEPGDCFSACVYAFLGGRKRTVRDQDRLGVHRFYRGDQSVDRTPDGAEQVIFGRLLRYVLDMGVDARLLQVATGVRPNDIRYIRTNELIEWRIATPRAAD
jgi:hypothetical protein